MRRGLFATLVLLCLVLLTLRALALAYVGSQGLYRNLTIGVFALTPVGVTVLLTACMISVCVDWYLVIGLLRAGPQWLAARPAWARWFGLLAPLGSLWISLREVFVTVHAYASDAEPPLGPGHWPIEFAIAAMQALTASLLAVGLACVFAMAARRT